ncbi:RAD3-like DEAD/DEAH box helicase [Gillisia mitskevichiae]|uniref:RAD3-like DEAD/DEAH box helicase n=1 Tax=Gillisia mitskevichiae TaxID=270921 RepID=A0A495NY85_9FLAO|nr:DEAD/DEAH box helicase [Gillisia mitskevichiae]RKS42826.1 RAD3-like DEAD/DEAH box helicase [Gillisia mitskevichiae]
MPFKKLNTPLKEALERLGIEVPTPFQKKSIAKIKSGANFYGIAPEGAGKTTAMIISTIQKLNSEAYMDAPRALIYVKDKESALELELKFKEFTRYMDLRVYCAYDEQNIDHQKDDIYAGVDIVIATPSRINKLFSITGIHLGELQLLILEDAHDLLKRTANNAIYRIYQSITKCQYLVFTETMSPKVEKLEETLMTNAIKVTVKEASE